LQPKRSGEPPTFRSTTTLASGPRATGSGHRPHDRRARVWKGTVVARFLKQAVKRPRCRRCACTVALQAGVHPKVVSERLGHATISTTLDTYSHAIPAMQEEAAVRIAELVCATR
jgi:integrase